MKNKISIQTLKGFLQAVSNYPSCGLGFAYESRCFEINEVNNLENISLKNISKDDFQTILLLWFVGNEGENKNPESLISVRLNLKPPEESLKANFVYRSGNAVDDFIESLEQYFDKNQFEIYHLSDLIFKDYPLQEKYLIKTEHKKILLNLGLTD